jgi:hypothetical protein
VELKLSELRTSDELPSLNTYIQQKREFDLKEQVAKDFNPEYDDLFATDKPEEKKQPGKDDPIEIDPRNYD